MLTGVNGGLSSVKTLLGLWCGSSIFSRGGRLGTSGIASFRMFGASQLVHKQRTLCAVLPKLHASTTTGKPRKDLMRVVVSYTSLMRSPNGYVFSITNTGGIFCTLIRWLRQRIKSKKKGNLRS